MQEQKNDQKVTNQENNSGQKPSPSYYILYKHSLFLPNGIAIDLDSAYADWA